MDKLHPLNFPMVVHSLEVNKDRFQPIEENEQLLSPKVSYLNAIGALMYIANCTRPNITFYVNLLARYNHATITRYWNKIKHILWYLHGTSDISLCYSKESKSQLIRYVDIGYLSNLHKARSQTRYVFTYENVAILWRSIKQTMVVTSSNHSKILAIHEARHECVWLRYMIKHIQEFYKLSSIKDTLTILHKDNVACIA